VQASSERGAHSHLKHVTEPAINIGDECPFAKNNTAAASTSLVRTDIEIDQNDGYPGTLNWAV
jgi:hypothetical protein